MHFLVFVLFYLDIYFVIREKKRKNDLDGDFCEIVLYIYIFLPLIRISGFDVKYSFILGNVPFKF